MRYGWTLIIVNEIMKTNYLIMEIMETINKKIDHDYAELGHNLEAIID
ncbi:MAG: hypothetical protein KAR20_06475 [Candidatus Heimdallarchaeota archaeon]|nr:hypothetical protein [Candidatus Heimdallarchaeota archaeon]